MEGVQGVTIRFRESRSRLWVITTSNSRLAASISLWLNSGRFAADSTHADLPSSAYWCVMSQPRAWQNSVITRRWASSEYPSIWSSELTLTYVAAFMFISSVPAVTGYFIVFPPLRTELFLDDLAHHRHESP